MSVDHRFANKKLMTPGPVSLPDSVKYSLGHSECHHRTKEFEEVLARVFQNLKSVFQTQQHCYMLSSTGTGAMEAALVHCLSPGDKLLTINAGKFGERWGKIAKAYGFQCDDLDFPWGESLDLNKVEEALQKGYKALAFQACETSTGSLLPSKDLAALANQYSALSICDGITALGAVDLPMDDWGLDVVVGGSQKAFMLPTGMSFISLSQKAEAVQSSTPKYYWDLLAEKKSNLSGQTRWSTPNHFVLALDIVLDYVLNEVGLKKHLQSIIDRAEFFRSQVKLELYPQNPSPSLSCLKTPAGVASGEWVKAIADQGYVIMGGQDQLKNKVLRIGHMGAMTKEDLQNTADLINKQLS
ncbi:MAG: alanine--glyoxylate aminotransferase family protein [Bdellovibrionales bacterium]|nr:alanine--glyoxylate aminotransferase family protein [Bdellovibrionales bacterium]